MNRTVCTFVIALTAVAAIASGAFAAPRPAESVREAQVRLNGLGYYAGPVDGVMGQETAAALRDFQGNNGLQPSGRITADTAYLLRQTDVIMANGSYYVAQPVVYSYNSGFGGSYVYHQVVPNSLANWTPHGRALWAQAVPNRFANMMVSADHSGVRGTYSVLVNGQPVLVAHNQAAPIRVSKTYMLNGQDAVIFTSADGSNGCSFRNYLVTVRADGTYDMPREVGNCSGGYQANVVGNQLVLSFPTGQYATASTMWDRWALNGRELAKI